MSFAENLRKARKAAGMTQQQVADKMGVTKSTYCGYETEKRQPDVPKIKQLSEILGVPSDYLLETEKAPAHEGERRATDEEIKFALFDGQPVTDEQYEEVKRFAKYVRDRDIHSN